MRRKFLVLDQQGQDLNNSNVGNLSQISSAYEVTTAKVLKDESSKEYEVGGKALSPEIFCASRSNWLLLCIDSDLYIFDLSMGCVDINANKHKGRLDRSKEGTPPPSIISPDEGRVIALTFLPSADIFTMLLNTGTMVFGSPMSRLTCKISIIAPIENCSMCIVATQQNSYSACILDRQKSLFQIVSIPEIDWSIRDEEAFQKHFASTKVIHTFEAGKTFGNLHFVASMGNSFVCLPRSKGEMVTSALIDSTKFRLSALFTLRENLLSVRTVGPYLVALMTDGRLAFFDENLVLCQLLTLISPKDSEHDQIDGVLDFESLDADDPFMELNREMKILLKVKTKSGQIQFMIKQLDKTEMQFSTECSQHTIMIPHSTPGDDKNIIYVDAFPSKCPDSIFVRFVNEAQPLTRLSKLLDLKRFDTALDFAKANNLSLDLVYSSMVRNCLEKIQAIFDMNAATQYEEVVFVEMMRNLRLISDKNNAADLCVATFPFLDRFDHIKIILDFTKNLIITDEYTLSQIEAFRYHLASYRMVYGSDNSKYAFNSEWPLFQSSETHKDLFDQFCAEGKIAEARILFTRYVHISSQLAGIDETKKLLACFRTIITANPTICPAIGEFIESDLMTVFLYGVVSNIRDICLDLCDFFISISMTLEEIEPKSFPKNALHFSQTFNRAIQQLKNACRTADQYTGFTHILKQLDEEQCDSLNPSSISMLGTLIRNLTELDKIHTTYQCPMSYAEYLTQNVHSICYRILDRVRAATSVKDHIERFLFPYIEEHRLNRNEMLHSYIKELASSYRTDAPHQPSTTLDLLSLQITEQITDINMRCRAIIEISSGTMPPWNQHLSNMVRGFFAQSDKVDPQLIAKLREQTSYADLGQIFIAYQIPLDIRSRIIGANDIQSLLRFIFKNSDKEMAQNLKDSFKICEIYDTLHSSGSLTTIDCYYLYAIVLIQHFSDEAEIKLMELFHLIKSQDEVALVSAKLVAYFKALLSPSSIQKITKQRHIWLQCLLCVIERFMTTSTENKQLIRLVQNIIKLHENHNIVIGFDVFRNKNRCTELLAAFIESPSGKSIIDVVQYGKLLCLSLKETCKTLLSIQIRKGMPEAVLKTISYLLSHENSPTKAHLEDVLHGCAFVFWRFTATVKDETLRRDTIEYTKQIVEMLHGMLPKLVDWSVRLETLEYTESFFKIHQFIDLFSLILVQYTIDDSALITTPHSAMSSSSDEHHKERNNVAMNIEDLQKQINKLYTLDTRMSVMLPHQEGRMFDPAAVIKAISVVASSVLKPPVETCNSEEFMQQMRESWEQLFISLSSSHVLLEIHARQFANTLPCFTSIGNKLHTSSLNGMDRNVAELCKKIFTVPIADLYLAAHLLCSLPADEIKLTLNELRRWALAKKNVRTTLNLIRVSMFVLILAIQDIQTVKQVATWFQQTQWQKRLFKRGVTLNNTQLKADTIYDLAPEFVKVLLPSSFLKEYCEEVGANGSSVLLHYGLELCKFSSCLRSDGERFKICIDTAKMALREITYDENSAQIINQAITEICPYNYEAVTVLLNKLQELKSMEILTKDNSNFERITDYLTLLDFLRSYKRGGTITTGEIRWYKQFVNPKYYDMSSLLSQTGQMDTMNETMGAAINVSVMTGQQLPGAQYSHRHDSLLNESTLPRAAKNRLPFHMFLFEERESVDKYLMPFIHNEITIYNVQHWILLVDSTKLIIHLSRSTLLVAAIQSHVHEVVKYKRELGTADIQQINNLVYGSNNRLSILKALTTRFQRISLSQTKIDLINLGTNIAIRWVENFDNLRISGEEQNSYVQSRITLHQLLAVLNTEFLLSKNGLLDADTATLTEKPDELINHLICNGKIDWTDIECIDEKFNIITEVSKIHRVDLEDIFNGLIDRWIYSTGDQMDAGGGGGGTLLSSDPDSTIDFMGSSTAALQQLTIKPGSDAEESAEFCVPVLYDDPQITRIIMLLRRIENPIDKIIEMSRKSSADIAILPGGYMTKIRISSCILRFLDNSQMQELLNIDINQFLVGLVSLLNQRLYSICRVEIPSNELQTLEMKLNFVRSILSPQSIYRQTPEMAHLLVCLIVDNGIDDLSVLSKTAHRLLQLRLPKSMMELLKYIRSIHGKDIKTIANLSTYFGRTFETLFSKLDYSNEHDRKEIPALIHFILGCPVEGDSQFMRAESMLICAHARCAAALVAIAANAVTDISYDQQPDAIAAEIGGPISKNADDDIDIDIKLNRAKI